MMPTLDRAVLHGVRVSLMQLILLELLLNLLHQLCGQDNNQLTGKRVTY